MTYSPHLNEGNLVKSGIVLADVICGWERSKNEEGEDGGGGKYRTEGGEWKITPLGERNRRTDEGGKEKQYAEEGDSSFTGVYSTTQRFITKDDTLLNSSFHSAGHENNDENISSYNIPPPNIPPPPTPNLLPKQESNVQHISTSHPHQDNLLRKNAVSRFSPELPQVRLLGDSINKVEDEVQEGVEGLMEKVNIYVWGVSGVW
jgi:hypothetical protein